MQRSPAPSPLPLASALLAIQLRTSMLCTRDDFTGLSSATLSSRFVPTFPVCSRSMLDKASVTLVGIDAIRNSHGTSLPSPLSIERTMERDFGGSGADPGGWTRCDCSRGLRNCHLIVYQINRISMNSTPGPNTDRHHRYDFSRSRQLMRGRVLRACCLNSIQ
jgi:hypothetical protein